MVLNLKIRWDDRLQKIFHVFLYMLYVASYSTILFWYVLNNYIDSYLNHMILGIMEHP